MSRRTFTIIVVAWILVLMLAASDLGAMIGFLAGVTVAMFGGAIGAMLQSVMNALGIQLGWTEVGSILATFAVALVVFNVLRTAIIGIVRIRRGDERGALASWAASMSICAGVASLWLGSQALARVWP